MLYERTAIPRKPEAVARQLAAVSIRRHHCGKLESGGAGPSGLPGGLTGWSLALSL
jgi:hypothetical protein